MRLLYIPQTLKDILPYEPTVLAVWSMSHPPLSGCHVYQMYNLDTTIYVGTKQNADNMYALTKGVKRDEQKQIILKIL